MNYYQFHIGDFRSGTINMSRHSRWIYRDMMDVYYDSEEPLPLDMDVLCDMLGVSSDDEKEIVRRHLRFKFDMTEAGYTHEVCEKVISEYRAKADVARANGKLGGRPKGKQNKPNGYPLGSDEVSYCEQDGTGSQTNHKPLTINQEPEESKALVTGEPETDGFELSSPEQESVPHGRKKLPFTYTDIQNAYNKICRGTFKGCDAMTPKRKGKVRAMVAMEFMGQKPFRDLGIGFWEQYFTDCLRNPHWCGNNDRGWKAHFEFVTTPDNALKILEVE